MLVLTQTNTKKIRNLLNYLTRNWKLDFVFKTCRKFNFPLTQAQSPFIHLFNHATSTECPLL